MFYNITDPKMTIEKGDTLAARCTMVNNENRTVKIGLVDLKRQDKIIFYFILSALLFFV